MTLEELIKQGFASYKELRVAGIGRTINLDTNEFALREKTIIDIEGNYWNYMEEDGIYEYNPNRGPSY